MVPEFALLPVGETYKVAASLGLAAATANSNVMIQLNLMRAVMMLVVFIEKICCI